MKGQHFPASVATVCEFLEDQGRKVACQCAAAPLCNPQGSRPGEGIFNTVAIMRAGGWKSVGVLARYLEKAEHNVWG
jgi:hypothetical protein